MKQFLYRIDEMNIDLEFWKQMLNAIKSSNQLHYYRKHFTLWISIRYNYIYARDNSLIYYIFLLWSSLIYYIFFHEIRELNLFMFRIDYQNDLAEILASLVCRSGNIWRNREREFGPEESESIVLAQRSGQKKADQTQKKNRPGNSLFCTWKILGRC